MDTVAYPDPELQKVLSEKAVPVRLNILKEREQAKAMRAIWTPLVIFIDGDGREQHRFLGYHPPREYAAVVLLTSGLAAFGAGKIDEALTCFERIGKDYADSQQAPEATYWRGVCAFKKTKSTQPIYDACREIVANYPNHFWAKKIGFVSRYRDFNNIS
jgi:TolA-binding protein